MVATRSVPKPPHASAAAPAPAAHVHPTIRLRHGLKRLFNHLERVGLRLLHHLAHRLLDQVAVGQAQRIGLGQVLLDGLVLLGGTLVGPDVQVAQQFHPGQLVHAQKSQRAQVGAVL